MSPRRRLLLACLLGAAGVLAVLAYPPTRDALAVRAGLVAPPSGHPQPPFGVLDRPVEEALFSTTLKASGWALDVRGIESVEARIADKALTADYGLPRTDVGTAYPEFRRAEQAGFAIERSLVSLRPLRFPFEIVATNADGVTASLGRRSLVPPGAMRLWEPWADEGTQAFHVLMAASGIASNVTDAMQRSYGGYLSGTHRIGAAVTIPYMRTTRGRNGDWAFDPAFDVERACGGGRLAHDALQAVLDHAARTELPVQFSLVGEAPSNAACDSGQWDLQAFLIQSPEHRRWSGDAKSAAKRSSTDREPDASAVRPSLTLNVYAREARRYHKRNLQDAARVIAVFARRHPHLVVGVDLDGATALQRDDPPRFDYHPGTLRQFREWLRGDGPYAGKGEGDVPDLSAFARKDPLTLAEVNRLAGERWKRWDDVDPPRVDVATAGRQIAPAANRSGRNRWMETWEAFCRHLVAVHRHELVQWTREAGVPEDRIFVARTVERAGDSQQRDAVHRVTGRDRGDADMDLEYALPRHAHAGIVVQGASVADDEPAVRRQFATLARSDPGWAVLATNLGDAQRASGAAAYAQAYRMLRDLFNFDARQLTLVDGRGQAGSAHVAWTALRNTPADEALRDHLVSHAGLPLGSRLWTFGSAQHVDDDGWTSEGAEVHADRARLVIEPASRRVALVSPPDQVIGRHHAQQLVVGVDRRQVSRLQAWGRQRPDAPWSRLSEELPASRLTETAAGLVVPLRWPSSWRDDVIATQVRVTFTLPRQDRPVNVDRIALIGRLATRVPIRSQDVASVKVP